MYVAAWLGLAFCDQSSRYLALESAYPTAVQLFPVPEIRVWGKKCLYVLSHQCGLTSGTLFSALGCLPPWLLSTWVLVQLPGQTVVWNVAFWPPYCQEVVVSEQDAKLFKITLAGFGLVKHSALQICSSQEEDSVLKTEVFHVILFV